MVRAVDATYENGVFVPATPPGLREHARVRLVIEPIEGAAAATEQITRRRRERVRLDPDLSRFIAESPELGAGGALSPVKGPK